MLKELLILLLRLYLDCLKNDEAVKIAGFGTYKVAKRKARIGRNPRTGEQIQISASQKVKFLPAKGLKICSISNEFKQSLKTLIHFRGCLKTPFFLQKTHN